VKTAAEKDDNTKITFRVINASISMLTKKRFIDDISAGSGKLDEVDLALISYYKTVLYIEFYLFLFNLAYEVFQL